MVTAGKIKVPFVITGVVDKVGEVLIAIFEQ